MPARFGQLKSAEADSDPCSTLHLTEDDFSVRVASALDPIFWVRVERDTSQTLVITDFNPGGRPVEELEAALGLALNEVPARNVNAIVFRDLTPGSYQPVRLVRAAELAKQLASRAAASLGQTIKSFRLETDRNGHLDAIISLV